MDNLQRWLDKQTEIEENRPQLEDVLIGAPFWAYARYRLSYYSARLGVDVLIHLIEFVFLTYMFDGYLLAAALFHRTVTFFVSGWWWGGLERLREDVRVQTRLGRGYRIPKIVAPWLHTSILLALAVGLMAVVIFTSTSFAASLEDQRVLSFYTLVVYLNLALALPVRAYHSGIYAIRRVYRPLVAVLSVDLIGFATAVLLWPTIEAWSYPLALLMSGFVGNALTWYYVREMYKSGKFRPFPPLEKRTVIRTAKVLFSKGFHLMGAAATIMRLESVILFILFTVSYNDSILSNSNFVVFYLLAPLVRAGHDWATLFYFDFKRLSLEHFRTMRIRFQASVRKLAFYVGALLWGLSVVLLLGLGASPSSGALALLLPFFIGRSALAFTQVRSFTEGRYLDLLVSGGLLVVAALLASWVSLDLGGTAILVLTVTVGMIVVLELQPLGILGQKDLHEPLPFNTWLNSLASQAGDVIYGRIEIAPDATQQHITYLGRSLAYELRRTSLGECSHPFHQTFWWFSTSPNALDEVRSWCLARGDGLVTFVPDTKTTPEGKTAIADLITCLELSLPATERSLTAQPALSAEFKRRFPDGIVVDLVSSSSENAINLPKHQRRNIVSAAVQYARALEPVSVPGGFWISAALIQGDLQAIFAAPKSAPIEKHYCWESFLMETNLKQALNNSL